MQGSFNYSLLFSLREWPVADDKQNGRNFFFGSLRKMKLKKYKITIFAIAEGDRREMHSLIDTKMPFSGPVRWLSVFWCCTGQGFGAELAE